jgi:hypothetical protein
MALVKLRNVYGKEIKVPSGAVQSYKNLGFFNPSEESGKEVVNNAASNIQDDFSVNPDDNSGDNNGGEENGTPENGAPENGNPEKTEDEIFVEEIEKKPIASWNKDEVKKYAALKDIDLKGTKSADEAKERIKDFMKKSE